MTKIVRRKIIPKGQTTKSVSTMTLNMDTQGNSEEKKNSKKEEKENFIQKTGIEGKVEREEDTVTGGNFLKPSKGSFNELNTSKKRQREKRTFHAVLSNKKSKQNKQRKAEEYDDEEKQGEKQNRFTKETFDLQAQDIIDTYATASHNYQSPCCIQYLTELVKQAMKDIKFNDSWKEYIQSTSRCLPNGFVAMTLLQYNGYVLRLHHFNQKTSVDGLHSHKWDFESMILCGRLNSENWSVIDPQDKNTNASAVEQTTTAKFLRKREEGDTTKTTITLLEREVHLKLDEKISVEPGNCYFFPAGKVHRVMKSTCATATLVLTHPKYMDAILYDQLHEHIFDEGKESETQTPPKATLSELNQFIDLCIHTLYK
jgi:hypothetical protein